MGLHTCGQQRKATGNVVLCSLPATRHRRRENRTATKLPEAVIEQVARLVAREELVALADALASPGGGARLLVSLLFLVLLVRHGAVGLLAHVELLPARPDPLSQRALSHSPD
eukprot:3695454-Prymnesium_polylepis.1